MKLTGTSIDPNMLNDLKTIIIGNDNNKNENKKKYYYAAEGIAQEFEKIRETLISSIIDECTNDCKKDKMFLPEQTPKKYLTQQDVDNSKKRIRNFYRGWTYHFDNAAYEIRFSFEKPNFCGLIYGLHDTKPVKESKHTKDHPYLKTEIKQLPEGFSTDIREYGWIIFKHADDTILNWNAESLLQHWDNDFADIKAKIKEYIATLMEIIRENKEKLDNPNQQ